MGREQSSKTSFLFTTIMTVLLASTSLAYAIDPNAAVALQNANKEVAGDAQNMQERIARMEDQVTRMNEELIAMREQKVEDQRRLHQLEQTLSEAR